MRKGGVCAWERAGEGTRVSNTALLARSPCAAASKNGDVTQTQRTATRRRAAGRGGKSKARAGARVVDNGGGQSQVAAAVCAKDVCGGFNLAMEGFSLVGKRAGSKRAVQGGGGGGGGCGARWWACISQHPSASKDGTRRADGVSGLDAGSARSGSCEPSDPVPAHPGP